MTTCALTEMIEAALEAWDVPPDALDAHALVLERVGDALRAGLGLPRGWCRWLERRTSEELGKVIEDAVELLAEAPAPSEPGVSDELVVAAVSRDRTESTRLGVERACLATGRAFTAVPGFERLVAAQQELDAWLARTVTRDEVEQALGIRRALLAPPAWTDVLPEGEGDAIVEEVVEGLAPRRMEPPSAAVVVAYVQDGLHKGWVEAAAASDPWFAQELAETVALLRGEGEPISLVARQWERQSREAPVEIEVPVAAAADDGAPRAASIELLLGVLSPTDAAARMTVAGERVTLHAVAGETPLVHVSLGGVAATDEGEKWRLEVPWSDGDVGELVVEDAAGRRFACPLRLTPGPE